jgi:hypothetical protein
MREENDDGKNRSWGSCFLICGKSNLYLPAIDLICKYWL